ncbi:MAG: methionyl-tRNA formyltransferase [candidate division WOR-3 bacterium]|nr:methionyl-tRNA formyltransferase [candidate division WOR-3 bacterium]MCX7947065.1 methionyl-tRNA formyltransferase [candidate division WOR-3 bacterium]MDW8149894.1 methionyl-tRNA formyltransferase [candidate division WOR-3 bacterium]
MNYYFSSGDFGSLVFLELLNHITIQKVITIPDRKKGRGLKEYSPAIKKLAQERNIEVIQVESPEDIEFKERPDFIIVCDYGKILKTKTLMLPKIAPLNIHPSLLPKYRGPAPIERTMMDGEELGISIIVMNEKVDEGKIVKQEKIEYSIENTKGDLLPILAKLSAKLLKSSIDELKNERAILREQEGISSYARKIKKEELFLDFNEDYIRLVRKINALSPKPTARAYIKGMLLKFYRAIPIEKVEIPGKIYIDKENFIIGAIGGGVKILEVQPENSRRMSVLDFINGYGKKILSL